MRTQLFTKWLQLVTAMILLLAILAASQAQADQLVIDGIISAGNEHTCALRSDGSIDCWGNNAYAAAEDQPGPYIQLSAGGAHTCALTTSGAVDCWGLNNIGQAEDQFGPYTQVSAGESHTCAITPSGAIDCWGDNDYGKAEDQPGPYAQVDADNTHTCALTPSGAVNCWGDNSLGQAEDQPGPYTQVSTSIMHTCALSPSGAVDCWGWNGSDQAEGQAGPYIQVNAGLHYTCALTTAGAVDCWGNNYYGAAQDQPGPYTQVTASNYHTCALTPAGAADCWGNAIYNDYGQNDDQTGPYGPYNPGGDTTPPVVTVTGVTQGSTYILGAVPQAGCSTTDEDSGVAVEASLSLSGGNALGVGSFTATCSGALDNAGNPGNTATVNYNVTFQFTGFTGPVDSPPVMNLARAGQTIPLKWRLTDANGNPITNLTNVSVTASDLLCDSGSSGDAIEEYVGSNSGLQNLGDGYYQWNWKTPTTYASSCKTLKLELGEGIVHTALFQFKG